jgi:hypothetical protein
MIEAQPVFGQIKPSQRPGASHAETQSWEKRWLIPVMHKRSEQLGVEKETQCGKWRNRRRERPPSMFARIGVMRALNRHVEQEFNPDRKEKHWGRRKLARDR